MDELGTIVEADSKIIKVRWDKGATSYFRRDIPTNLHSTDNRRGPQ